MATVDQIMDRAISLGDAKALQSELLGKDAILNATAPTPVVTVLEVEEPNIDEPNVFIPSRASGANFEVYDEIYARIIEDLSGRYADYLVTYFPTDGALRTLVEGWIHNAVENGGTGINATVEAQIWSRDRDRINTEASALADEAVSVWAAKGYPIPPGAALATLQNLAVKRSTDINASSRDAAIKAFETEVSNVRFAIETATKYRTLAVQAAGDYIRAMAQAPDIASKMANLDSDGQARLISAVSSFYGARINAAEAVQRSQIANQDSSLKAQIQSIQSTIELVNTKASTAVEVMKSLGQQAASALNAVNATAQKQTIED